MLAAFAAGPRIAFIRASQGVTALNATADLMHELGRPRGDMWEVGLWEDVLTVQGSEAFYAYQVHNQAIVIPENIDAIRALSGHEPQPTPPSSGPTAALGFVRDFYDPIWCRDSVARRRFEAMPGPWLFPIDIESGEAVNEARHEPSL